MAHIMNERSRSDAWQPLLEWADTHVQWGGNGLVLGHNSSYTTAFFEAFPQDGSAGFIRGEGKDKTAAEASAHKQWRIAASCSGGPGHLWSRNRRNAARKVIDTYDNGGCFCQRCGAFQTQMKPIVKLGDWRKPLSSSELTILEMVVDDARDEGKAPDVTSKLYIRRLALRLRAFGAERRPVFDAEPDAEAPRPRM